MRSRALAEKAAVVALRIMPVDEAVEEAGGAGAILDIGDHRSAAGAQQALELGEHRGKVGLVMEAGEADDGVGRILGKRDSAGLGADPAERGVRGIEEAVRRLDTGIVPALAAEGRQVTAAAGNIEEGAAAPFERFERGAEFGVAGARPGGHRAMIIAAARGEDVGIAVEHATHPLPG